MQLDGGRTFAAGLAALLRATTVLRATLLFPSLCFPMAALASPRQAHRGTAVPAPDRSAHWRAFACPVSWIEVVLGRVVGRSVLQRMVFAVAADSRKFSAVTERTPTVVLGPTL